MRPHIACLSQFTTGNNIGEAMIEILMRNNHANKYDNLIAHSLLLYLFQVINSTAIKNIEKCINTTGMDLLIEGDLQ